jgi:hypothetical protein
MRDVHVVPVNDLRERASRRDCWCQPRLIREAGAAVVVVHQSADGRELVEQHGVQ